MKGAMIRTIPPHARTSNLTTILCTVWEKSVRATHLFLSDDEIKKLTPMIPAALQAVPHLIVGFNAKEEPVAFMGIDGRKVEMLFIAPEERGHGLGRRLLQYGIEQYGADELCVNEQNPQAKGFYEHMGFQVYKRSALDEQGNPYPILHMHLRSNQEVPL